MLVVVLVLVLHLLLVPHIDLQLAVALGESLMNCSLKVTLSQSAPPSHGAHSPSKCPSLPWCPLSLKVPLVPTLPQSAPPFSQSDPQKTTANFWPEALWWTRHNAFQCETLELCPMQPVPPLIDHILTGVISEGHKTTGLFAVVVLAHHV